VYELITQHIQAIKHLARVPWPPSQISKNFARKSKPTSQKSGECHLREAAGKGPRIAVLEVPLVRWLSTAPGSHIKSINLIDYLKKLNY